jgi:hypothetical protein
VLPTMFTLFGNALGSPISPCVDNTSAIIFLFLLAGFHSIP